MPTPKYAPPRESDGLKPYVLKYRHFTFESHRIVWAATLAAAKCEHVPGRRPPLSYYHVRRATPADMEAYAR
ncbi:hypothetical protein CA850_29655 [Micromonospora echinospora]|uniref:Uncharacterized protein n=1 Tax=Micromonospora echinospora TaxID=1877 RepID=A0A1C5ABA8_MICEC|nr:hypothetical protein [Micromonospora echinospora]OZV74746.1 hypothetical protein CA850_29655 [Micromonospora echinospora]SCF42503.1 hypothetical protein GA0070618_6669 [Micromonospora echinospora]